MIKITSIKEKNILSSDREEALKFIKQWKQELIMMSSVDNADNVINTICKALEAKEPEVVSIDELAEYMGQVTVRGFEHDRCLPPNYYNSELRCVLQFAEDTKEISKELLRMYPNGIIIKGEE